MPEKLSDRLISWATIIDGETVAQAHRLSKLPFIEGHVALMPDAHLGMGATIGSVIPTLGAIVPAAVGVDLGCGMVAVETTLTSQDLPDDLRGLLNRIEEVVPAGLGKGHDRDDYQETIRVRQLLQRTPPYTNVEKDQRLYAKACNQFGTLGSGNHFLELCLDGFDGVWIMLHSGSRGIGNILARQHISRAKGLMKEFFIHLEDPELAYLAEGTEEFDAYIRDLRFSQAYAFESRSRMMDEALLALAMELYDHPVHLEQFRVNCHHNYAAQENHRGKNVWVTRKGAISARPGEFGIIPGAMGGQSFIVKGLGNVAAYHSAPHGAGRMMSRRQAKRQFTTESLAERMAGVQWLDDRGDALLDEHPGSYKDVSQVIRDSADLVQVVHELKAVVNYKGTQ